MDVASTSIWLSGQPFRAGGLLISKPEREISVTDRVSKNSWRASHQDATRPNKHRHQLFNSNGVAENPNLPYRRRARPPRKRQSQASSIRDILLSKLESSLRIRDLLKPQQKVLVAVSGGQDSVSLLYLLARLRSAWGWTLGIVHCDHQWSPSSRTQASHVAQLASYFDMDYYQAVATKDVTGESAARSWRYGILQRIASSHGYTAVLTAHTATDRVETLLHNLFRGTGLHGLLSLSWKRDIVVTPCLLHPIAFSEDGIIEWMIHPSNGTQQVYSCTISLVRPLLDIGRSELTQFCKADQLPLWPDPSNFSMGIRRNRIRHQLLPFLKEHFQPTVDKSLLRWAEILHGEDAFLESLCESIRKQAESPYDEGGRRGMMLDLKLIGSLPVALQRRVLKQFVENFSHKSLGFDHVERLRVTCVVDACRNGLHISLPGDVQVGQWKRGLREPP